MKHTLPELAFAYDALEPYIDAKTMEIHHTKHHQGYINKYLKALEGHDDLLAKDVEDVLRNLNLVPEEKRQGVINNGGGYFNHRLFWTILTPEKTEASAELLKAIDASFGSFDEFKDAFTKAAATRFGSGWAWLVKKEDGTLAVVSTPNQDAPFAYGKPILGLDVWEHAYYLNYQNRRPDYISNFWNVVNWKQVSEYFAK
ncbi:superoxide dismutase [Candidatus Xianfuyuplasma coldseepsis]|uniref:Superoxide dismutase n=1 Tax=Candidatus Xianfuyuplasma coldseepsis TaxID=2782163 RepID=A0A7L7KQX1_9MOLU|nr:superoxide dismutase [Xianfuyuplasma coldseepsis]QMS84616.1 superoxide dismutase [Xianfuyuplasma coldseepsis]